jgi:flagellar motor switch protein FliN/FliY
MSVGTELLMNVHHEATVEIARTRLTGEEITQLTHGSVIELDKSAGEPVDIVLNGKLVAHGEIVVINREKLGVRVIGIHQG